MRPTAATATAAALLAAALACTPQHADTAPAGAARAGPTPALPAVPAGPHPPPDTGSTPAPDVAPDDPQTVAAAHVLEKLEDEGLLTLDLNLTLTQMGPGGAQVDVEVLHGTGRSHPTPAAYTVHLTRHGDSWAVERIEVAP